MSSANGTSKLKLFGIISILVLSFLAIYYVSTDSYQKQARARQERADVINTTQKAQKPDQVVLKKNERREVGRTALVYRGMEEKAILVDLYLLDLDPKQGYTKKVSIPDARQELKLGGVTYRLVSANNSYLTMKILRLSQTP